MNVKINGNHIQISEALEEFTMQRLDKLDRYLPNIVSIQVDLSHQNNKRGADQVIAQITLRHERGAILRAEEKLDIEDRDTIKKAINGAIDKMYVRIQRFKGKGKSKRIHERYKASQEELLIAETLPEEEFSEEHIEEILRRKEVSVIAMTEEEAIEQMELLGHNFFLFFNPNENKIQVVYRREASGYGVLNPNIK